MDFVCWLPLLPLFLTNLVLAADLFVDIVVGAVGMVVVVRCYYCDYVDWCCCWGWVMTITVEKGILCGMKQMHCAAGLW